MHIPQTGEHVDVLASRINTDAKLPAQFEPFIFCNTLKRKNVGPWRRFCQFSNEEVGGITFAMLLEQGLYALQIHR